MSENPDILLLVERHRVHSPVLLESLSEHFVVHQALVDPDSHGDLDRAVAGRARALVTTTMAGASADLINALPRLEIIVCIGGSPDRIDLEAARRRGIPVTDTPHISADDVADLSVTHVLSLARRATEGDRFIRAGRWPEVAPGLSVRVTGKTAGILGLGYIGRRIAKRLEGGFGMRILYHGRRRVAEVSYEYYTDLRAMARDSDFLIVSCATGQATRHLVGRTELEALGSSGYLIGISRGVIQEDALLDALAGGVIAGAGLDVFEEEPDVPAALMDMNNVVLTPHVAAMTQETKQEQMDLTIENLLAHFQKRPLLTPVT